MSVPGGPTVSEDLANGKKVAMTSKSGGGTMQQLVAAWQTGATRWETLMQLRVLRLRQNVLGFDSSKLPAKHYPFFASGRLSSVGVAANPAQPPLKEPHLDIDWFGPADTNWWPGKTDGAQLEIELTERLTTYLEWSFGLGDGQKGTSAPLQPTDWTWDPQDGANPDPWKALKQGTKPATLEPLSLRWEVDPNNHKFLFSILADTTTTKSLVLVTPKPKRLSDTELS